MFVSLNASIDKGLARRKDGEKGFTLIELLVVVIIIGILAAIAIPVFLNQRQSAWKASVSADLKNAATAIETAATQNNGVYPANAAGTITTTTAAASNPYSIKVSTGNSLTVALVGTTGYTIVGTNSNLTGATDYEWYNSTNGGLKTWGAGTSTVSP